MMEQWKEDPTRLKQTTERIKMTDNIHVQKKANSADPTQFAITCLAQCTGVSVKMAEALITQFGSLQAVMAAPVKEIEQVKVGARKVGPVVSKRLHEILTHAGNV
jgi:excinuclease UvrABC nuclease subunit